MNTPRYNRRITRFPVALVTVLLLIFGSLAPAVSAQTTPDTLLATRFFSSITGAEGTAYVVTPATVLHSPEGDYAGHAGLVTFGSDLAASFTNLEFSVESAVQAGQRVIVSLTITGINTGSYHGLAATCAGITIPAVAVLQVRQQRNGAAVLPETVVVEQWIDYDRELIASQIAAVNLMDSGDRPACSESVAIADQDASDDQPSTSPLPPGMKELPF